jgi:hypothetical protein
MNFCCISALRALVLAVSPMFLKNFSNSFMSTSPSLRMLKCFASAAVSPGVSFSLYLRASAHELS